MPVDVRVNTVSSRVRMVDPDALLTPEVLARIVEAVRRELAEDERTRAEEMADRVVGDSGMRIG